MDAAGPLKQYQLAIIMIVLATWPLSAPGQVADLLTELLPSPVTDGSSLSAVDDMLMNPYHINAGVPVLAVEYDRGEPFTDSSTQHKALWSMQKTVVRYAHPLRWQRWTGGVAASGHRVVNAGWIDNQEFGPKLEGRAHHYGIDAWVSDGDQWFGRIFGPVAGDDNTSPQRNSGWELQWIPNNSFGVLVQQRDASYQSRFHAPVIDDAVDFRLNQDVSLRRIESRFELFPGLMFTVAHRDGEGSPILPLTDDFVDDVQLNGDFESSTLITTAHLTPNFEAGFSLSQWSLESEGGLYWGGQRYGRLNILLADGEDIGLSLRWQKSPRVVIHFDAEQRSMSSFGRGKMESWPFSETAIDLLGLKQIAEAEFDLSLGTLGFGTNWVSDSTDVGIGAAHHVISLDGFLETWIPGPLNIGRIDFVRHEITVDKIRVNEIRLDVARRIGPVELGFDVRQILTVSLDSPPDEPSDPDPDDEPAPTPTTRGWWGGLFLSSHVVVSF